MTVDFGAAFRPPPPPSMEVRLQNVCDALDALVAALNAGKAPAVPGGQAAALDPIDAVNAVVGIKGPATAGEIADALAARLRPPSPAGDAAQVLAAVEELTKTLDFRLKGLGQAFGSSGTVNVTADIPFQLRDKYAAENRVSVDTEGRLNVVATDLLAELRRRRIHRVASADATAPSGTTYTTVVEFTPGAAVTITGFNADFTALVGAGLRYRVRLVTGADAAPAVLAAEELSTDVSSWVPLTVDIAAGTRVAIQVIHGELTPQEFRATVIYFEEP